MMLQSWRTQRQDGRRLFVRSQVDLRKCRPRKVSRHIWHQDFSAFYERAGMMQNLNGSEGSVSIIGAVSPQGGDFSEPVTQNTKRFVRCFWGLDKRLAYARHFPAIQWLDSYSEYLTDLAPWYAEHVDKNFVEYRNRLCIYTQSGSISDGNSKTYRC